MMNGFTMWKVLCELTGSTESTADAELTVEVLKERSGFSASDEEWEEMCWAVDLSAASSWAHEDRRGKTILALFQASRTGSG